MRVAHVGPELINNTVTNNDLARVRSPTAHIDFVQKYDPLLQATKRPQMEKNKHVISHCTEKSIQSIF